MAKSRNAPAEPTITFWGAARTVTGSMHRVEACGQSLLLDCGLFQGRRAESRRRNEEFPFRPKDIDAVLLSHAHIDHCGNLPNLVRRGFAGPIYCTPATRALAAVMLGDAAKIQEEDAAYLNRKREKGEPKVEPLYDGRDVYQTLLRLKAAPYDSPTSVGPGLEATFVDAGHLLGSAMIHLRIDGPGGGRRLTFTGDLGRAGLPILRDPSPVPPADLVISESTYGGHTHEPVEETAERLGEVVRRTAARGGKVVIPAFAVGRTQTVVYFLHQLTTAGRLPDVPVYVDSPMAVRATEVFRAHPECFNDTTLRLLAADPDLFGEKRIHYVEKVHESIALNDRPGPCVILSASGMCEGGRVLHHLKHNIEDARNTILIVGFQAADTLGRRLVERRPEVRILGRTYRVKAEVVTLNGLSSHADHGTLLRSLGPLAATAKHVRLVHGEPDRATALAEGLRAAGFVDVAIPDRGGDCHRIGWRAMTFTDIRDPVHVFFGDGTSRILRGCKAVLFRDDLAVGPCHLDPVRHAEQRRAYWWAQLEASSMQARFRRKCIASLAGDIFSAHDFLVALSAYPENRPVLLWTAPLWMERLSFWWTLDALRQGRLNPERFWVAEAHVAYAGAGMPEDTSFWALGDERLTRAFADRRQVKRGLLRSGAAMWRRYAASSPRAFDAIRRRGNPHFPDLPLVAEVYGMLFPRVVGSRSTILRLSTTDQVFFDHLQTDAWVRPIDVVRGMMALGEFLFLVGDSFLSYRLQALAEHSPENPLLLSRRVPEGVNHLTKVAYQLTRHGVRVRDRGLERADDVAPLFVGGCQVYTGTRPWVRRLMGNRWRIERLHHTP